MAPKRDPVSNVFTENTNITHNNHITNNNSKTINFIINNYTHAPNIDTFPQITFTDNEMRQYINNGVPQGAIQFIHDLFIKYKNPPDFTSSKSE